MTAAAMHAHRVEAGCDICEGNGYLLDQGYGEADIPDGWVPVQACDECRRFGSDERATREAARQESQGASFQVRYFEAQARDVFESGAGDWAIYVGEDWSPQAVAS